MPVLMQTVVSGVPAVKRLAGSYTHGHSRPNEQKNLRTRVEAGAAQESTFLRLKTPKAGPGRPLHTQPGAAQFWAFMQATAGLSSVLVPDSRGTCLKVPLKGRETE